ncbi:MAG: hypothetical protein PHE27_01855 [Alphaproteobacteria bacterium]|nr:hypothetical protein [Alphaproteobacteria bacterium]
MKINLTEKDLHRPGGFPLSPNERKSYVTQHHKTGYRERPAEDAPKTQEKSPFSPTPQKSIDDLRIWFETPQDLKGSFALLKDPGLREKISNAIEIVNRSDPKEPPATTLNASSLGLGVARPKSLYESYMARAFEEEPKKQPPVRLPKNPAPNLAITLPPNVFVQRTKPELEKLKKEDEARIASLDVSHPLCILYERRFLDRSDDECFKYYKPDIEAIRALPPVEPYRAELNVPDGCKLLIVTGYHRLERPYGLLFSKMLKEQMTYDPEKVAFFDIEESSVATYYQSYEMHEKVRAAVARHGATHMFNVHEQISWSDTFSSSLRANRDWNDGRKIENYVHPEDRWNGHYRPAFIEPHGFGAFDYTVDSFVPTPLIELATEEIVAPPFQTAINSDLRELEKAVRRMKNEPTPSNKMSPPRPPNPAKFAL